jgi:hypothetical protein
VRHAASFIVAKQQRDAMHAALEALKRKMEAKQAIPKTAAENRLSPEGLAKVFADSIELCTLPFLHHIKALEREVAELRAQPKGITHLRGRCCWNT